MPKETSYELKQYLQYFDDGTSLHYELSKLLESVGKKIIKKTLMKKKVNHEAYDYRQLVKLIDDLRQVYELLGVLSPEEKEELIMKLSKLKSPYREEKPKALSFDDFHECIDRCISILSNAADKLSAILEKSIVRDPIERSRFIEGLNCFLRRDFLASIVMIASALERRLFLLMRMIKPDRIKKLLADKKLTFGALIKEYLDNKEEYKVKGKYVVPEEYEYTLWDINKWRALSAHPEKEIIGEADAKRIITGAVQILRATYKYLSSSHDMS